MIHKVPKYPIYIPSKGRWDLTASTMRCFDRYGIKYNLVVEEQEAFYYEVKYPNANVLVLPFSNLGSGVYARKWIREHAIANGHDKHWQFDDNIIQFVRKFKNYRTKANPALAICWTEHFTDRFENVGISGINYSSYIFEMEHPVTLNGRVYSMMLYNHDCPVVYRTKYNEDADNCLQALAMGWCTLSINIFGGNKAESMALKGGNTDALYKDGGRMKFAASLAYLWPGIVSIGYRHGHIQHQVYNLWKSFAIAGPKPRLKPEYEGVDWPDPERTMVMNFIGKYSSPEMDANSLEYERISGNVPNIRREAKPPEVPDFMRSEKVSGNGRVETDMEYTRRDNQAGMFGDIEPAPKSHYDYD